MSATPKTTRNKDVSRDPLLRSHENYMLPKRANTWKILSGWHSLKMWPLERAALPKLHTRGQMVDMEGSQKLPLPCF